MWIDTARCPETFHEVKRDDQGRIQVYHSDDTLCQESEYDFSELAA
jgi:hypothetical protein